MRIMDELGSGDSLSELGMWEVWDFWDEKTLCKNKQYNSTPTSFPTVPFNPNSSQLEVWG